MNKLLNTIFGYKLIKKDEYADLEKEVMLSTKEREELREKKNKTIKANKEKIEQLETIIETKDNILKKRDKELHEKEITIKYLNDCLKKAERDKKDLERDKESDLKDMENLELEISNLKEELQQKKRLLSRFEVTKEEIKAYENNHREVLKRIRGKRNV